MPYGVCPAGEVTSEGCSSEAEVVAPGSPSVEVAVVGCSAEATVVGWVTEVTVTDGSVSEVCETDCPLTEVTVVVCWTVEDVVEAGLL